MKSRKVFLNDTGLLCQPGKQMPEVGRIKPIAQIGLRYATEEWFTSPDSEGLPLFNPDGKRITYARRKGDGSGLSSFALPDPDRCLVQVNVAGRTIASPIDLPIR